MTHTMIKRTENVYLVILYWPKNCFESPRIIFGLKNYNIPILIENPFTVKKYAKQ